MNKFWMIILHTFLTKIKSKQFIISTAIMSVLVLGITNISSILNLFENDEQKHVAVIDKTGQLFGAYNQLLSSRENGIQLENVSLTEAELKEKTLSGEYEGYVILSYSDEQLPSGVFKAKSVSDERMAMNLSQPLQQLKESIATTQIGLSKEQIQQLYEPVSFELEALAENAKTSQELNDARGLVYILLFAIYVSVIMYASMIAMEVATEKSSRVMEILISSVSPIKLMFGKIIGVALVSVTQLTFLFIIGFVSFKQNSNPSTLGDGFLAFETVPLSTFIYAIIFFILGYFLFATLAAFLGSLVSRIEDVQQMITPMTMLIVIAFIIAVTGLSTPEANFITITSFIPFFAPMIMFLRVGMLNVPFWEVALSISLLIATIGFFGVFGAKVYRGGVLMYGNSSSWKDIKKAIKLTKGK